jgi:peroxin-12
LFIKCEHIVTKWREELLEQRSQTNTKQKQKAIHLFKYTTGIYELLKFVQYLRFLTQATSSHTPLMGLLHLGVTYLEQEEEEEWSWRELLSGKLKMASLMSGFLFRGLELSAFFLQFIQWWQTEASQGDITSLPVPPPPNHHPDALKYRGICPICLQKWTIPTAISISG